MATRRRAAPVRRVQPKAVVTPPGSSEAHTALVNACLLWLSANGQKLFWSNQTGALFAGAGRFVRFGLKGSSDIIGALKPTGRMVVIECKTGGAVLSDQQKKFRVAALEAGAVHITARSLRDLEVLLR